VTDETITAQVQVAEGARLVADTCQWLAQQTRQDTVTRDGCMWMALAALATTVTDLAEAWQHPTFPARLARDCDGTESALLMLRALGALHAGEHDRAEMLCTLAAGIRC